jgi:predicted methyltransferase
MTHVTTAQRIYWAAALLCAAAVAGLGRAQAADRYDAAVAHAGRSAADLKRDALDHPAEMLRLAGIGPGMHVADILGGGGYYSELLSHLVGPRGRVLLINNAAFDYWTDPERQARLAKRRLPNVEHRTIDLDRMHLGVGTLDAILLIKVFHDLYWVDSTGESEGLWPKIDTGGVLDQLARALKPGGVLLLIDHSAKSGQGSADASTLHRIDSAFAVTEFERRGLAVIATSDLLRKPEDPREQISYKSPMLGKTDRFVVVFRKASR